MTLLTFVPPAFLSGTLIPLRKLVGVSLIALVLPIEASAQSQSQSTALPLDGKVFEGVFLQRGKTRGDADVISFRNGRLHSSACDQYGYGEGTYTAVNEGDAIRFETETESPKYGKLRWSGIIRGQKLDATVMMMQPGKAPVENWVVAGSK